MAHVHHISDDEFSFEGLNRPAAPPAPASVPKESKDQKDAAAPAASREPSPPAPLPAPGRKVGDSTAEPEFVNLDTAAHADDALRSVRPGRRRDGGDAPRGDHARALRADPRHLVQSWLRELVDHGGSDLILRSGGRPSLRVDGRIRFLAGDVPGPGPMLQVMQGILGPERLARWTESGSADAAVQLDGLGRFRINAYKQMGEPAIVIRRISENAPTLDDLNLPAVELKDLAMRKRGLVFVTGVAGSGKSTTLAAMIEFMNRTVERHIVTLEDPVELLFRERYCVISQREVGADTPSFKDGLKHALRQSPDVILIGEVRDAETVIAALEAVETGHLVMSTMHTVNASQTVDRILGFFPAERHVQIRQRMAQNLAGVLSMRLVPRVGGGLVPAYELLQSTPQVRELLEQGQTTELGRVIGCGNEPGLISFNQRLLELVRAGLVDLDDALGSSDRPDELLMAMRGIRGSADRTTTQAPRPAPAKGAAPAAPRNVPPAGAPAQRGPLAGPEGQQRRASDPGGGSAADRHDPNGGGLRMRGPERA